MKLFSAVIYILGYAGASDSSGSRRPSALDMGQLSTNDFATVVIMPDTHGDRDATLRSLWLAVKQVNGQVLPFPLFVKCFRDWNEDVCRSILVRTPELASMSDGRRVALIQLGDVVGRGPQSLECMDIFTKVERVLGWHMVSLLGNHEIAHIVGNYELMHSFEKMNGVPAGFQSGTGAWPLADIANRYLLMARLSSPTMGEGSASSLFVHGGVEMDWLINQNLHRKKVADINVIVRSYIQAVHTAAVGDSEPISALDDLLTYDDSPVTTRSLDIGGPAYDEAEPDQPVECNHEQIDAILEHFKVARIIVGHNPQADRTVKNACGGKVVLTDVLMSRWMTNPHHNVGDMRGGRPVAVIMQITPEGMMESFTAHYTDLSTGEERESTTLMHGAVGTLAAATGTDYGSETTHADDVSDESHSPETVLTASSPTGTVGTSRRSSPNTELGASSQSVAGTPSEAARMSSMSIESPWPDRSHGDSPHGLSRQRPPPSPESAVIDFTGGSSVLRERHDSVIGGLLPPLHLPLRSVPTDTPSIPPVDAAPPTRVMQAPAGPPPTYIRPTKPKRPSATDRV